MKIPSGLKIKKWSAVLTLSLFAASAYGAQYTERTVNFSSHAQNSKYTVAKFRSDFGNVRDYRSGTAEEARAKIVWGSKRLLVYQEKNQAAAGILAKVDVPAKSNYYLQFYHKFNGSSYDLTRGGKYPGVCGGQCWKGGNGSRARQGNGWSVRLMWRTDCNNMNGAACTANTARLIPYVYHKRMSGTFGDDFGYNSGSGLRSINRNQYYTYKLHVKANSPSSSANGWLRVWVDGSMRLNKRNIQYATNYSDTLVDTLLIESYHGGATVPWQPSKRQTQVFDNFKWDDNYFAN